jgi:hypothetical protein
MYVRVLIGYERGVRLPGNGATRPRFGQLYSDELRNLEVLHLWPLDFPMNTKASTTVRPLTLWHPTCSGVTISDIAFTGLERLRLPDGGSCWVFQRWLCEPMTYSDAKAGQAQAESEKWRWIE